MARNGEILAYFCDPGLSKVMAGTRAVALKAVLGTPRHYRG
jgi:hypothetical protein